MLQKRLGQLSDRFLKYGLHKSLRLFCVYFCFDKFFEKRNNIAEIPIGKNVDFHRTLRRIKAYFAEVLAVRCFKFIPGTETLVEFSGVRSHWSVNARHRQRSRRKPVMRKINIFS